MKQVDQGFEILDHIDEVEVYKRIEDVARTCYKSHDHVTEDSAAKMVRTLIKSGHDAMLEFSDITVRITCDRAIANELVRHRVGTSYAQESTRYCNYSKDKFNNELTFIRPYWYYLDLDDIDNLRERYELELKDIEKLYNAMCAKGLQPQAARSILPLSLKTELNVKMNLRAWRHFFELRCSKAAHPDMRRLATELLVEFYDKLPVVFEDLYKKYVENEE